MILACKDVHKSYGINIILDNITFNIEENEKAALVGVNGAGKTTLFEIISQNLSKDSGEIFLKKDIHLGYLKQNSTTKTENTIYGEVLSVFNPLIRMEEKLRELEKKMALHTEIENTDIMNEYSMLQHKFEESGGYSYKSRIKGVLKGLGFLETEYSMPVSNLSGGQKTRIHLGKLLLSKPDLLLLDEPTNHLDIESIEWLEDFLKSYTGSVLIISHDRYFIDKIVTKIIDIENKRSYVYKGNYTSFTSEKERLRESQLKQYNNQQKELKRQEEIIKTLRSFNREKSIKRAESREKNLEKIEKIEKPENLPEKMRLTLNPKIQSGKDVLNTENLSMSFGEKKLFSNVSFDIKRSEKVAIIGPNGIGKSTLFKIILGEIKNKNGEIKIGTNVNLAYYDQEQQNLNLNKTVFQEISDTYPEMTNLQIRNAMALFVFTNDDIFKSISSLSGGEKGRVALAKIMLSNANVLMLDEPTNHLDMYSKEILENAINNYSGTVIYISHDRYFINRTAEKILELTQNGVNIFYGNYDYLLEKKYELKLEEMENAQTNASLQAVKSSSSKDEWLKQKEEQAKSKKISNQIDKIEKSIEKTEEKINELDTLLFTKEISTDFEKSQEIFKQKSALETELENLYAQWENLQ